MLKEAKRLKEYEEQLLKGQIEPNIAHHRELIEAAAQELLTATVATEAKAEAKAKAKAKRKKKKS